MLQVLYLSVQEFGDIKDCSLVLGLLLLAREQLEEVFLDDFLNELYHAFVLNLDFPVLIDVDVRDKQLHLSYFFEENIPLVEVLYENLYGQVPNFPLRFL